MDNNINEPIRVLEVIDNMGFGGAETLLMNLYRNIDRRKVQFDFAITHENYYDDEIKLLGGRLWKYPHFKGYNLYSFMKWWDNFFRQHPEYHIVHGHVGSSAAIYLSIAKKYGRFTIAHSHSTWGNPSPRQLVYKWFSYPTRYIADYFFGCSYKALVCRYGNKVAENKNISSVLKNGIDAEKFRFNPKIRLKMRKELGINENELILTTVGRLTPPKNPFETIKIICELKNRGLKFRFFWFGTGELETEVKKKVKEEKLEDIVIFAGVRKDIYNCLQAMDIFVFPSVWEGLSIADIEAQASGLPTIISDTVNVTKETKVTDNCQFIELNNTDAWCDEIEKIALRIKKPGYIRNDNYKVICDEGYDIRSVSHQLEKFYINIYRTVNK